jgi:hypothetical protein
MLTDMTGAADGTVKGWSLADEDFGEPLFTVTAHSGAVTQMRAMPAHPGTSYSGSTSAHGLHHMVICHGPHTLSVMSKVPGRTASSAVAKTASSASRPSCQAAASACCQVGGTSAC